MSTFIKNNIVVQAYWFNENVRRVYVCVFGFRDRLRVKYKYVIVFFSVFF